MSIGQIITLIVFGIVLIVMFLSLFTNDSKRMSDYDLYGMDVDEYEKMRSGMSDEEYKRYINENN